MEKINADYKRWSYKFRLNFSRCTNPNVAFLTPYWRQPFLGMSRNAFFWGERCVTSQKTAAEETSVGWNWPTSLEKYLKIDWSVKMPLHWIIMGVAAGLLVMGSSFSSPEAALILVSTKNRDLSPAPTPEVRDSRTLRYSAHAQSQVCQIELVLVSIHRVYKAIQNRNIVGPGQRSRFLVLTKQNAASGARIWAPDYDPSFRSYAGMRTLVYP